jgi:hypothetical protein
MENALANIVPEEYRQVLEEMARLAEQHPPRMSRHQIEHFVLNDVEFCTPWMKLDQARHELLTRFYHLRDMALDYEEKLLQAQLLQAEQEQLGDSEIDTIRKKILDVKRQRMLLQADSIKSQARALLGEAQVFYETFAKYKHLYELPKEEQERLEAESWAAKAQNFPNVFEERYGEEYLRNALGAEKFEEYKKLRRELFGILPRELMKPEDILPRREQSAIGKGE